MKHFIITFVLLFTMGVANANSQLQVIEKSNVKLSQIVGNAIYNLNEPIAINDDIQEKVIKKSVKKYRSYDISNACITAFMKWCDKFVGGKRDYVIFRLPLNKRTGRDSDIWSQKDELKESPLSQYENNEAQIEFDPFVEVDTLNGFIVDNKVVLAVSKIENGDLYVVNIDAVMPYKGKYYRYETAYRFYRQLDYEAYKTKDVDEICFELGNLIAEYPSEFFDRDGWLLDTLFLYSFRWDFDTRQLKTIQEIDINPNTERITVKSLFYNDND